jgi:hypothetical protein
MSQKAQALIGLAGIVFLFIVHGCVDHARGAEPVTAGPPEVWARSGPLPQVADVTPPFDLAVFACTLLHEMFFAVGLIAVADELVQWWRRRRAVKRTTKLFTGRWP